MKITRLISLLFLYKGGYGLNREILPYMVGALLYMPAYQSNVIEKLKRDRNIKSIAFCLEDTIEDNAVEKAELCLLDTLKELKQNIDIFHRRLLIFIRIRTPNHMKSIMEKFADVMDVVTGIILPKFDESNAKEYLSSIRKYNLQKEHKLFAMPILESCSIASVKNRVNNLCELKSILDEYSDIILNVRVGGNDLSNLYGLRRDVNRTIYDIGVVRDILTDIINIFAQDYVVSAPVWEYYGKDCTDMWAVGLRRELEMDKINGFVGKTAIHPSQIPVINESLKVSFIDYKDALEILEHNYGDLAVSGNVNGTRMNETKCHTRWAERIKILASVYGVREM